MRHSIIAYLGVINSFDGYIDIENNEIEDASIAFFTTYKRDAKLAQIKPH
jgi:hypothetical protein